MAKDKAVYAPGELAKVRGNLGNLDNTEAKRMAQILGGEVGVERGEGKKVSRIPPKKAPGGMGGRAEAGKRRPLRRVETSEFDNESSGQYKAPPPVKEDPADDPMKTVKLSYRERVKMDKYMGQLEFGIKSSLQVLISMLSFFNAPLDMVKPSFVNRRLNDYYKRIETLAASVRSLLPRNDLRRNEQLRKVSPFAFATLDTMRFWNIDQLSANLTKIQAQPRNVTVQDLAEILRDIYKPLYILQDLDSETHIKGAFKMLYKVLYLENPGEAKEKYQDLIRTAISAFGVVRRDVHFRLYPLLMKLLSDRFIPYEDFFSARKNRIAAFLQVSESNKIDPGMENAILAVSAAKEAGTDEAGTEQEAQTEPAADEAAGDDQLTEEDKAKKQQHESEKKALERGLSTLEALFPSAGWDRIREYPDLYPYFASIFKFQKGYELVAPGDPLQQVIILMHILEEFFFGLRYVNFGSISGTGGGLEHISDPMTQIMNEWQKKLETTFDKEYMSRLNEYCRLLENTAESKTSNYATRLFSELCWIKRLHFLPYYRFDSIMPPPFQKKDVTPLYSEVRRLRKFLTAVAGGIDQGNKLGGMERGAACEGIDNPWDPYEFQVPNPVSVRLNALLPPPKRNNATLIFFALAVVVVLDYLINNEDSWAYDQESFLFRSENNEGIRPMFGVDTKVDAEALFKQSLKQRQS